jgi:hypothetical protein
MGPGDSLSTSSLRPLAKIRALANVESEQACDQNNPGAELRSRSFPGPWSDGFPIALLILAQRDDIE